MRVFNLGIGVFTLALLWTLGVLIYLITRRIKSSLSIIGPITILFVSLITLILSLLPRYKLSSEPKISEMDKMFEFFQFNVLGADWLYIWRSSLITFNVISIITVSIIIYSNYISKKNIRLRNEAKKATSKRKNSIESLSNGARPVTARRRSRAQINS